MISPGCTRLKTADDPRILTSTLSGALPTISIALNGTIARGLSPDELRERLRRLIERRAFRLGRQRD